VRVSIIVATRNRAHAITGCLDSIAAGFAKAAPLAAEIVVVDNGSTDNTFQSVTQWAASSPLPARVLSEPKAGLARAHNRALLAAQGELLAFTDDDCRLRPEYINDLLRHHAADSEPVLRGGRVELGDPSDLPLTINTRPEAMRWNRRMNSLRHLPMCGLINGCNMTMPRTIAEKLGPFDERFGGGAIIPAGCDTDYFFRAYLADITLEYVPDMAVAHFHGRKTPEVGRKLLQEYLIGNGALLAKHAWKHPNLARQTYWDLKNAIKEILAGGISTTTLDYFSHRDKVLCSIQGAIQYFIKAAGRPEVSS
jgi:glycosyltransferase involved in cell wall biosynthesis